MTQSDLEAAFAFQLRVAGLPDAEREYMFALEAMGRRWRWDFCWPDAMLAVELQGGVWARGRHSRGAGYIADCEKSNAGTLLGWRLLRFTREQVESGYALECVERAMGGD